MNRIGYKIGFNENKIIRLVETTDYPTPTDNPRQTTNEQANERKNKSRTRSQYKTQHKNAKKKQKGKHSTATNRLHTNQ